MQTLEYSQTLRNGSHIDQRRPLATLAPRTSNTVNSPPIVKRPAATQWTQQSKKRAIPASAASTRAQVLLAASQPESYKLHLCSPHTRLHATQTPLRCASPTQTIASAHRGARDREVRRVHYDFGAQIRVPSTRAPSEPAPWARSTLVSHPHVVVSACVCVCVK